MKFRLLLAGFFFLAIVFNGCSDIINEEKIDASGIFQQSMGILFCSNDIPAKYIRSDVLFGCFQIELYDTDKHQYVRYLMENSKTVQIKGSIIKESVERQCENCKTTDMCQASYPDDCSKATRTFILIKKIEETKNLKEMDECEKDADCNDIDCSKYDKPGLKEGYRPYCQSNKPYSICKCLCKGCE